MLLIEFFLADNPQLLYLQHLHYHNTGFRFTDSCNDLPQSFYLLWFTHRKPSISLIPWKKNLCPLHSSILHVSNTSTIFTTRYNLVGKWGRTQVHMSHLSYPKFPRKGLSQHWCSCWGSSANILGAFSQIENWRTLQTEPSQCCSVRKERPSIPWSDSFPNTNCPNSVTLTVNKGTDGILKKMHPVCQPSLQEQRV